MNLAQLRSTLALLTEQRKQAAAATKDFLSFARDPAIPTDQSARYLSRAIYWAQRDGYYQAEINRVNQRIRTLEG